MTSLVAAFRRQVSGTVVGPGVAEYDELRKPWLTLVDQHPSIIVSASSVADVAATVRLSREHGLDLGVMSTGHGLAAPCDGGVLLNLRRLATIEVDPRTRIARVEPGATSADLLAVTEALGLVYPAGQAGNVGVTSFTLGGGIGWLMRKLGPASSSLRGATVVLADGAIVRASATENADLFWALRGGGGNFGVVVEVELELAAIPRVHGGLMVYPVSRASEVLRTWRDWTAGLGDDTTTVFRLMALPVGWMPKILDGLRLCMIGFCHADPATAPAVLEPLAALGSPLYQDLGDRTLSSMVQLDIASHLSSSAGYGQSDYLRSLSDAVIDDLLAGADRHMPPLLQLELQHLGGALAASGGDGAFEPFNAPYLLRHVTEVSLLDPLGRVRDASDALATQLREHFTGRSYLNFLRWDEAARAPTAFTPEKYDRLREIKQHYDPENRFHLNFNIAPACA